MHVSAVIPCYNNATTIERAVVSCLNQSHSLIEIIVVNDGSKDDTEEVLSTIKEKYTSLILVNQANAGVCAARNTGVNAANGDYILMLDADDYFEPTFVEKALEVFEDKSSHAAVMSGYRRVVDGKKGKDLFFEEVTLKSCLFNNGMIACVLFKKKAVVEVGLYDEQIQYAHEDWDLNIRLLKNGYTFGIINEALFNYTTTPNSRSSIHPDKDMEMRMRLYEKYKADFEKYDYYIYESIVTEWQRLRRQNKRIVTSRSYKFSKVIVDFYNRFK
jgi:glycosyltransferase involved in cell wall biosynthesis